MFQVFNFVQTWKGRKSLTNVFLYLNYDKLWSMDTNTGHRYDTTRTRQHDKSL